MNSEREKEYTKIVELKINPINCMGLRARHEKTNKAIVCR